MKILEISEAASQANGRRWGGPATPWGRERIRGPHTRHGFYSHAEAWRRMLWEKRNSRLQSSPPRVPHPTNALRESRLPTPTRLRMEESSFRQIWMII